ncbi:hypothetical protein GOBAR_AA28098 [Gossypium barbadense]|uniref:DUF4283 domain-containing protein n=1 Tax=Gossypium barbadense TaxID=3634 RepID=A0A2P5WNB5_GOSBA|nr:hypothetical protein GOBAR_AA28098 [Gossypium barbadense]
MGLGEICVKRIQRNYFLIELSDKEILDILEQREWSYLKEFFVNIEPWIAGKWGTQVSMGEKLSGMNNFEKIEMLISISQVQKLDEIIRGGDVRFSVSVREKGWSEESKNNFSQKEKSQVVADESMSESKSVIGLESEKLPDGDHDVVNGGILTEDDFSACRLNSGMDSPSGGHDGSVDFDEGLGSLDMEGKHLRKGNTLLPDQIYPNNHGIPKTNGRGLCQEIEEEFLNTVRDISNRRKVILREAKQTWELGKKLGLSVRGDERDVMEDTMQLEDYGRLSGVMSLWDKDYFEAICINYEVRFCAVEMGDKECLDIAVLECFEMWHWSY